MNVTAKRYSVLGEEDKSFNGLKAVKTGDSSLYTAQGHRQAKQNSSDTGAAHVQSTTEAVDGPDTPLAGAQRLTHKWYSRSRSIHDEEAAILRGNTSAESHPAQAAGSACSTSSSGGQKRILQRKAQDVSGFEQSHKHKLAACKPSLSTRIRRRVALSAKMLHRAATFPAAGGRLPHRLTAASTARSKSCSSASHAACSQPLLQPAAVCSNSSSQASPRLLALLEASTTVQRSMHAARPQLSNHQHVASQTEVAGSRQHHTSLGQRSAAPNSQHSTAPPGQHSAGPTAQVDPQQPHAMSHAGAVPDNYMQEPLQLLVISSDTQQPSSACSCTEQPCAVASAAAAHALAAECSAQPAHTASVSSEIVASIPDKFDASELPAVTPVAAAEDREPAKDAESSRQSTQAAAAAPATKYPDCLFDADASACCSTSFTTRRYSSSTGQQVAIVWMNGVKTAVFIKETSGEIWECNPEDVTLTGPSCSRLPDATDPNYQGVSSTLLKPALSAAEAARLFRLLNDVSSSSRHRSRIGGSTRGGCSWLFGQAGNTGRALSSTCSSSSNSLVPASKPGGSSCSLQEDSANPSAYSSNSCSPGSSAHSGQQRPRGLLAQAMQHFQELWQSERESQQSRAAAYVAMVDEQAQEAILQAGCRSSALPHNWPAGARKAVEQQRRLRVVLTAHRQ